MYNPQLETFITVAESGSFAKAADKLYISPTAVIKQINILESNLDIKLFNRTHRGLTLTAAGKSLYSDARYIIRYSHESLERAKNAMQKENGIIRIGTSPMTPAQILVQLWPKIHAMCPEIHFKLVPFDNTPQNAREILLNLGQNIDMVAVFSMPRCSITASAPGWSCAANRCAAPQALTIRWRRKTSSA